MACGCGKGNNNVVPRLSASEAEEAGMVLFEYVGKATQKQRFNSRTVRGEKYVFSGDQKQIWVYPGDVPWISSMKDFKRVEKKIIAPSMTEFADLPVLKSEMRMPPPDLPLEILSLDPIIMGLLRRKFASVNEVKIAGRAEWMAIKGMGERRADAVQEALDAL